MNMSRLLIMGDARSVHIERWCRYFADEGFEIALFSLEPKTISSPVKFYQGRRRTSVGIIDYTLAKKDFSAALNDFSPDAVSAHFVASYGWLASHGTTCPVVVTAWGSDLLLLPQKSLLHRKRIKRALEYADYCTVDNSNLHDAAARFMPPTKIIRVLMGIDRAFYDSVELAKSSPAEHLRIIAPRGLQKVYDPQTIINAAGLIKNSIDFRIDLLGEGPEANGIKNDIAEKSLSDRITVSPLMPHDDFVASLNNYDVYLSASLSDSTSVALLEAMTVGLFPVVSNIEGNQEWIEDGVNGVLFDPGSAISLAAAITKAANMRDRCGAIAKANRDRIGREAIWQDNMNRAKKLFLELIGDE